MPSALMITSRRVAGEIDFQASKTFLKSDTIKVIELKPGIPVSEVSAGIQFVREMLSGR